MRESELLIAQQDCDYCIKVIGRANFEYAPPIRELMHSIDKDKLNEMHIDLDRCTGMDSTFMGVLTMVALKAQSSKAKIMICNASDANKHLLSSLGIAALFEFIDLDIDEKCQCWVGASKRNDNKLETAEIVFKAHDTLMKADEGNIKKFEKVVEYARQDLEKIRDEQRGSTAE